MAALRKPHCVRHHHAGRIFFLVALTLASCSTKEPVRLAGEAQGTYYSIIYYDQQQRNLQPQIDSMLRAFDQEASLWVEGSLLRRLNANLTDTLSPMMCDMIAQSLAFGDYTNGAFNICIGPLVQRWGFSFRERQPLDSLCIDSLLHNMQCGISIGQHDGQPTLVKGCPETELDLNAIAQGYSSDLVGQYLQQQGIDNYLVDIGGEVVAHGKKPSGKPWVVGIERPAADKEALQQVQTAIALNNASVVTSGNYRKYYEEDGVRYSHTIDPTTGRPVRHSLLSVSVVEKNATIADAMATAYMVMGLDRAKQFIEEHRGQSGTEAVYFIYDDGGTLHTYATPAFEQLIDRGY